MKKKLSLLLFLLLPACLETVNPPQGTPHPVPETETEEEVVTPGVSPRPSNKLFKVPKSALNRLSVKVPYRADDSLFTLANDANKILYDLSKAEDALNEELDLIEQTFFGDFSSLEELYENEAGTLTHRTSLLISPSERSSVETKKIKLVVDDVALFEFEISKTQLFSFADRQRGVVFYFDGEFTHFFLKNETRSFVAFLTHQSALFLIRSNDNGPKLIGFNKNFVLESNSGHTRHNTIPFSTIIQDFRSRDEREIKHCISDTVVVDTATSECLTELIVPSASPLRGGINSLEWNQREANLDLIF